MGRVFVIVALVALSMATGVAGAQPIDQVRHPVASGHESTSAGAGAESVVVVKGDHLWKISARHLGEDAGDEEIAPYWREVIETNTPHLRSGDPDLIYPGEVVQLP